MNRKIDQDQDQLIGPFTGYCFTIEHTCDGWRFLFTDAKGHELARWLDKFDATATESEVARSLKHYDAEIYINHLPALDFADYESEVAKLGLEMYTEWDSYVIRYWGDGAQYTIEKGNAIRLAQKHQKYRDAQSKERDWRALSEDSEPGEVQTVRCHKCGTEGVCNSYPFSTAPGSGLCDDCF